jgi:hypothetical protein
MRRVRDAMASVVDDTTIADAADAARATRGKAALVPS